MVVGYYKSSFSKGAWRIIQGLGVIVFGFRPLRSEDWVGPLPYGHCMAHKWGLAIVILTYLSKWDGMILQVGFMDFTEGYLVVFFSKTGFHEGQQFVGQPQKYC